MATVHVENSYSEQAHLFCDSLSTELKRFSENDVIRKLKTWQILKLTSKDIFITNGRLNILR